MTTRAELTHRSQAAVVDDTRSRMRPTGSADRLNTRPAVIAQRAAADQLSRARANRTGLPDKLKAGVEAMSGLSLDDVRVHRNSPQPAQLQAHAFAQGSDIHLAPGQERHLPHEAWHVVQQKQGRVKPTMQLKGGMAVNDDAALEAEADLMGSQALQATAPASPMLADIRPTSMAVQAVVQRVQILDNGAAQSIKWYGDAMTNTDTFKAVKAVAASQTEGSGVYLSDKWQDWQQAARFANDQGNVLRLILPDLDAFNKAPQTMPKIMQDNGLTVIENCQLAAEHELVHLRQFSVNMKKGQHSTATSAPSFSNAKIKATVERLLSETVHMEVGKTGQATVKATGQAEYVRARLKYILSTYEKGDGNDEAPTVIRELNRYFQMGTYPERFGTVIASVKKLEEEENLDSLELPKPKAKSSWWPF